MFPTTRTQNKLTEKSLPFIGIEIDVFHVLPADVILVIVEAVLKYRRVGCGPFPFRRRNMGVEEYPALRLAVNQVLIMRRRQQIA